MDWTKINYPLKPFAHQYVITKNVITNPYHAVYAEMGTGKTKAVIDAYRLRSQVENNIMIVVCPKSVIYSWTSDLEANAVTDYIVIDASISKSKKVKMFSEVVSKGKGIIVMNYEQLLSLIDVPYACATWWVLDEAHNIKSHQAKRTKRIHGLSARAKYRTILTGTPIAAHPIDIWSQAWFLNPDIFNRINFYAFRNRYCTMGGFQNKQIIAYRNQDELKEKIARFSTQIKKEDCLDLPEKIYQPRIIEMPPEMVTQYKSMVKDLVLQLEDSVLTAEVAATKLLRLSQITSGVFLKGVNPKLEALSEIVDEIVPNGRQVLITYHFKESGRIIRQLIESMGISYSEINGSVENRAGEIEAFQTGNTKVFLGQDQSIREGVTLTRANYMVAFESSYSMTTRKQIEDRIHRAGQTSKCFYIDLCYKGTIDVAVHEAIKKKQDIATFLVDSFKKGGGNFKG